MKLSKKGEYAIRALIDLGIAAEVGRSLVQVTELAAHEKRTFDPAEFGFVFSLEEIEGRIRKRNLLEHARELRKLQTVPIRRAA